MVVGEQFVIHLFPFKLLDLLKPKLLFNQSMLVSVDFCLVPIGVGISLSPYIAECQKIIKKYGLDSQLGPNGTAIEGDWNKVFECIKSCHEEIHRLGADRIYTTLKVNTRVDRDQSFYEKVPSVLSSLKEDL